MAAVSSTSSSTMASSGRTNAGMLEESRIQEVATMSGEFPSHIPVLEDKYSVEENLAQLGQQQEEEMDIQEDRQQQHSQQAKEYTTSMAATSETSTATMSQ